jgi:hypothetical protein
VAEARELDETDPTPPEYDAFKDWFYAELQAVRERTEFDWRF